MDVAAGIYTKIIFPNAASTFDPRLSDLQKSMLDATPDCIKLISVDGNLLQMNKAGRLALSISDNSALGMPWLPLLSDDVRQLGLEALQQAVSAQSARFRGKSGSPDNIVYWDNLLTPVLDASGKVMSILCISRDVTEKTRIEIELEEAIQREKLLSGELQHRVKNLFSVASGLVALAEKEAAREGAPEKTTQILRDKLGALSRASDLAFSFSNLERDQDNRVDLAALIEAILLPYGERCRVDANNVKIHPDDVTNLALFLHELATNSIKYGALARDDGIVAIRCSMSIGDLELIWEERGGPELSSTPDRQGFGGAMIDRIVRSAGGSIERSWRSKGLAVDLRLPLRSI